jgi:hypothetical protein
MKSTGWCENDVTARGWSTSGSGAWTAGSTDAGNLSDISQRHCVAFFMFIPISKRFPYQKAHTRKLSYVDSCGSQFYLE